MSIINGRGMRWMGPLPLVWPAAVRWVLFWLVCMSLYRLVFWLWFGQPGASLGDLANSFLLGLRFDLRLALISAVPLLLLGHWPHWAPWSGSKGVRRAWQVYGVLISVAWTLLSMVDFAQYSYLAQRLNVSVFGHLSDPYDAGLMVWQSYPVVTLVVAWLLISAVIAWGLSRLMWPPAHLSAWQQWRAQARPWPRRGRSVAWAVLGVFLALLGMHGQWSQYPLRWSQAHELSGGPLVANMALNPMLNLYDSRNTLGDDADLQALQRHYPRLRELLALDGSAQPSTSHGFNFARKVNPREPVLSAQSNVVYILLESFAGYKSSLSGNALNTSPNIKALAEQGLVWDRMFSAHHLTARGVFASQTGLPDVKVRDTASKDPLAVSQNMFMNALPEHRKWYFIGGSTSWRNVRGFLKRSTPELTIVEEGQYEYPVVDVWGVSDHDVFKAAVARLTSTQAQDGKPFVAVIQTASNHRPYTLPKADLGSPDQADKFVPWTAAEVSPAQWQAAGFDSLDELNGFRYLDWSVGRFFEMARTQPWFKNTVFVMVGDHGLRSDHPGAHVPSYFAPLGMTVGHTAGIILAPGRLAPKRYTTLANQVDLWPTALGLMGVPYTHTSLGRDLLDPRFDAHRFVFNIDHEAGPQLMLWTDQRYIAVQADGTAFKRHDLKDGQALLHRGPPDALDQQMRDDALAWHEAARYLIRHNPARPQP